MEEMNKTTSSIDVARMIMYPYVDARQTKILECVVSYNFDWIRLKLQLRYTTLDMSWHMQTCYLRFGPYTALAMTAQSVNLHIAIKAMFYLLCYTEYININNKYYFITSTNWKRNTITSEILNVWSIKQFKNTLERLNKCLRILKLTHL